jgi:hypothetical protein
VRNPKASIISYAKLDPDFTVEELGIEAQWQHFAGLSGKTERAPIIMQSERVQADPHGEMQRYWAAVGLENRPDALQWSDDAPADWHQVAGWHQGVLSSKTVTPLTAEKAQEIDADFERLVSGEPRFQAMLDHHRPFYEKLADCSQGRNGKSP